MNYTVLKSCFSGSQLWACCDQSPGWGGHCCSCRRGHRVNSLDNIAPARGAQQAQPCQGWEGTRGDKSAPLALLVVHCTEETQGRRKKRPGVSFASMWAHQAPEECLEQGCPASAPCRREPGTALWDIIYFPRARADAGGCWKPT